MSLFLHDAIMPIPFSVETDSQKKKDKESADYDADDEGTETKLDSHLMPPPPAPPEKESLTPEEAEAARKRRLETPLASMMPSKYANISVTKLFPDFRPNKVLRFSRLFGPGKPSSLPQVWRGVKKRRKKRKYHDPRDSDSESDQETRKYRYKVMDMTTILFQTRFVIRFVSL